MRVVGADANYTSCANNIDYGQVEDYMVTITNTTLGTENNTIKNNTILKFKYQNKSELNNDLIRFLLFYNLYRRHGSLKTYSVHQNWLHAPCGCSCTQSVLYGYRSNEL